MKALKQYGAFSALIFVVLAVAMLFIEPALTYKIGNITTKVDVTAFKTIFGNVDENLESNILGIIAVFLLLAGAVIPFLKLDRSLKGFIAAIALVVSAILLIVYPSTIDILAGNYKAGKMLIISAVFAVLGGFVNLGVALLK